MDKIRSTGIVDLSIELPLSKERCRTYCMLHSDREQHTDPQHDDIVLTEKGETNQQV